MTAEFGSSAPLSNVGEMAWMVGGYGGEVGAFGGKLAVGAPRGG